MEDRAIKDCLLKYDKEAVEKELKERRKSQGRKYMGRKQELESFKITLEDLINYAVFGFGYKDTLKVIVDIAIKITDDEKAKVKNKNKEKGVKQ